MGAAPSQKRREEEQEGAGRAMDTSLSPWTPPAHPGAAQPSFAVCTVAAAARCPLAVLTPIQPHRGGEVSFLPP